MLLAIDAGNTNVVFAVFEGRTIKARWRIATDVRRTAEREGVKIREYAIVYELLDEVDRLLDGLAALA